VQRVLGLISAVKSDDDLGHDFSPLAVTA
jgi:hypothetical protein